VKTEQATLSVGYVAKRCGVNVSALHFYEQKGLIRSWRNKGNQRRYKRDVLRRISVIKAGQKIGVSLDSIKQTFAGLPNERTPNKDDWEALSARWKTQLDQQIVYMQKLRDSLSGCIGCGCLSLETCPIYNPDDVLSAEGPGPVILDRS
jgi:MerR family redox-sensitive transcriptional activator SoxR